MIEGYYGMFDRYVIKSQSGHTFIRDGKIPEIENANGELSTEFYALVKSVGSNKKVYLDRALKNAKKNIAVIEL